MTAQSYIQLLVDTVPRPIRTEADAISVQQRIDEMLDRFSALSPDEQDLLQLLGSLVESWETNRYQLPPTTPINRLRAHLRDNDITQASLVGSVFPTKSIASEVLSAKRPLTYAYVSDLMRRLHLPASFFFDEPEHRSVAS